MLKPLASGLVKGQDLKMLAIHPASLPISCGSARGAVTAGLPNPALRFMAILAG